MNSLKHLLAVSLLSLTSSYTYAAMVSYGFEKITNNNVEDISSQLSISIWDSTEANSTFGTSLLASEVLFTVQNAVGITSNIAEVYIDDGLLGPSVTVNSLGGFTNFSGGGAAPGNLPGGGSVGFNATTIFSADVNPGPPPNGVNESNDILGIILGLGSYADFNAITAAVDTGDLRFGYHVRSIGVADGSDSYVNVVPIPAGVWLFGSAIAGLIGFRSKRS